MVPRRSHAHFEQFSPLKPAAHSEHFGPANPLRQTHAPPIDAQGPMEPIGLQSHKTQGSFAFGATPKGR